MKTLAASALIALSGLFGAASYAAAVPDNVVLTNNDSVTNQGANHATGTIQNVEGTALGGR
ncbi:hypothetical protein [Segniliparus rugosus]|uniref:Uncharacterized protein n=1 Tax=Segniliparus rugosus (strain ATCC BAA-974 / DSM 45345 / CCUG 50838 / CIP 108380 / JCM 13579 / CDC 945) TaxID=679197 RepID=E5XSP2_SEGRC|nr:hypothetical protein [Segniliparus rugosus]EFV12624.1 hypothetical protein HMPREF9336_02514 [Segniliparus rugosus ATCC BAA-974]